MVAENDEPHVWFRRGVGRRLVAAEQEEVSTVLPRLYGYHLLFLGDPGLAPMIHTSMISHRILVNPEATSTNSELSPLKGELSALPLRTDSVDVVVLSHILEHVANPHEVLRET